jgi:phenylacetate-CoA ligase
MSEYDGITYEQILEMLMDSQYWPRADMLAFQRSQLGQLLRHAKANVPFYEKRLDCVFGKDGSINWERWDEIPILTREDLRDHRDAMQARVIPPGHGRVSTASSSGSTGVPITVSFPKIAILAGRAAWHRMFRAHGFDTLRRMAEFKLKLPNGQLPGPEPLELRSLDSDVKHIYIDRRASTEDKLAQLKRSRIDFLADTPNSLEILARTNLMQAEPLKFEGALGIGMGFSDIQRKLIAESFGARSVSPYSSKEATLIAAECPVSQWFHVSAELLHLECLDHNGKHVRIGQKGRAIITPFFFTSQPLIRYDQGDIIVPAGACPCGCALPTIKSIEGRSDPIFDFPGRKTAIVGLDFEALRQDLDAIATQIAQVGSFNLEIRYVASHTASSEGMSRFIGRVQDAVGQDISFTFKQVPSIPFNAGGKQQRMVREYQPDS